MFIVPLFTGNVSLHAGSEIITVKAEDADDPKTNNAKIAYEILSQEPQASEGFLFHIGKDTGVITLQDSELKTNAAKYYHLLVLAADLAGTEGGMFSEGSWGLISDLLLTCCSAQCKKKPTSPKTNTPSVKYIDQIAVGMKLSQHASLSRTRNSISPKTIAFLGKLFSIVGLLHVNI